MRSGTDATTVIKQKVIVEESSEDEDKIVRDTTKRKAPTDCANTAFAETIKARQASISTDFKRTNIQQIKKMSHGKLPQPRIDLPAGVEVFNYSGQKLNIWEFQKEQLRKTISNDNNNFYTYAKDFLSLAFPKVNEAEILQTAKQENIDGWKTKSGFDILNKKENYNLHPKKPHPSKQDELATIPYHW